MRPRLTGKVLTYALVALGLTVATVAGGRPELAAFAASFAVIVVVGLVLRPDEIPVEVTSSVTPDRLVEGDSAQLRVSLSAPGATSATVDLELESPHLAMEEGGPGREVTLNAAGRATVTFRLVCHRWGEHNVGALTVGTTEALGFATSVQHVDLGQTIRAHPTSARLRNLVQPLRTRLTSGDHVANENADGVEFAEIRPFVAGDQRRAVNWRASARRGELWINARHPERSGDVVLFIDSFGEVTQGDESTLGQAVRAAIQIANRYNSAHDRIGMLDLGGIMRWIPLGSGHSHLHRIVDALLDASIHSTSVAKGLDVLPRRSLPSNATIIALSPLLDRRGVDVFAEMHARGHDVAIVHCWPFDLLGDPGDERGELAATMWKLEHAAMVRELQSQGVTLARLHSGTSVDSVLADIDHTRRRARGRTAATVPGAGAR